MIRLSADARRHVSGGVLRRSRSTWMGLAVIAMFLFVACGGGDAEMFTASGEPMESKAGSKSAARSDEAAPDFELVLFNTQNHQAGEVLRLSQLQGRPVVVNFWFPSCPPCVAEMPDLNAAFQKHTKDGVEFVGVQLVGLDTARDGQEFVDTVGVTYALGPDETGEIFRAYKVTGFPTTVFLDENQNVVRKWTGFLNAEKIEEFVQELLN